MRRITALVLLALLALAAPTQAQTPTPTSAVAIGLDPGPAGIPLGASHEIPFQVELTLSNVVCTQAATATVTLAVADKPSPLNGVRGTVPATVTFTIPQGNYGVLPVSSPFEETVDAVLSINVTTQSLPNHEHTFVVTGTFEGTLTGCQGAGAVPRAEGSAEHQIKTGPAPAQGAARGATQTQGTATSGDEGSRGVPGLEAPILLVVAIGLAALRRRFHG